MEVVDLGAQVKEAPLIEELPLIFVNSKGHIRHAQQILARHTDLHLAEEIENPYWNITEGKKNYFLHEKIDNSYVTACTMEDLTREEAACLLQNAVERYIDEGTMGDFPKDDLKSRMKLTKAFIEGFVGPNTGVVMVQKEVQDEATGIRSRVIVGGVLLVPGKTEKLLKDTVGKPYATISTLKSLDFDFPKKFSVVAKTPENKVFCVSRLFAISRLQTKVINMSRIEAAKILPILIGGINIAREGLEERTGETFDVGFADISDERLLSFVEGFGWELVTDKTKPTKEVLNGILGHHYGFYSKDGRNIYAICATRENMDIKSRKKLAEFKD